MSGFDPHSQYSVPPSAPQWAAFDPNAQWAAGRDLKALASVGKGFGLLYLNFLLGVLLIITFMVLGLFLGTSFYESPAKNLKEADLGLLVWVLLAIGYVLLAFVFSIIAAIRFAFCPKSLVPGGHFWGVTYCLLFFLPLMMLPVRVMLDVLLVSPEAVSFFEFIQASAGTLTWIAYTIFAWKVAAAVQSQRAKNCVKWSVGTILALPVLLIAAVCSNGSPEASLLFGYLLVFGALVFLFSQINLTKYLKDDTAQIVLQIQNYAYANSMQFMGANPASPTGTNQP